MAVFKDRHWCFRADFCSHMTMQKSFVFGIRTFDFSIRIENACPEVQDALNRYVLPLFPRCDVPRSARDVVVCVDRVADQYRVTGDNVEMTSSLDLMKLLLAVL